MNKKSVFIQKFKETVNVPSRGTKTRRSGGQKEKTLKVPVKFSNQCESELSHTLTQSVAS